MEDGRLRSRLCDHPRPEESRYSWLVCLRVRHLFAMVGEGHVPRRRGYEGAYAPSLSCRAARLRRCVHVGQRHPMLRGVERRRAECGVYQGQLAGDVGGRSKRIRQLPTALSQPRHRCLQVLPDRARGRGRCISAAPKHGRPCPIRTPVAGRKILRHCPISTAGDLFARGRIAPGSSEEAFSARSATGMRDAGGLQASTGVGFRHDGRSYGCVYIFPRGSACKANHATLSPKTSVARGETAPWRHKPRKHLDLRAARERDGILPLGLGSGADCRSAPVPEAVAVAPSGKHLRYDIQPQFLD